MKKLVENLNKRLLQSIDTSYPVGLSQGKMGICIYFYHLSRIEQEEGYKGVADELLDSVLESLSLDFPVNVESGLAGIAMGITHLIKNGFIEGDVNETLEGIDSAIFKQLVFSPESNSSKKDELMHLLFYLSIRLSDQTEESDQYVFQELIIKILNKFINSITGDFFDERYSFSIYNYHVPLLSYICSRLLGHNFYNERIYKILESIEPKILSQFPRLHVNRLYLLCGILPLVPYMDNPQWKDYADLLHREIDLSVVFEREMKNKHIFVSNGLSMVYLLLYYLEKKYPEYKITYNPQDFYDKITSSDAWGSLFDKDYFFNVHSGLLNGFPGVQLVLSHIKKQNT